MIVACCSDIAGKVRGKAFPAADLDKRLKRGIGWTPTNVQITCFDLIAETPYGALGDLVLIPDPKTHVRTLYDEGAPPESFMLGDILETDGKPWECCTRSILKGALQRLHTASGLSLLAAFEQEFHFRDAQTPLGSAYSLAGFRAQRNFAQSLVAIARKAGLTPDTFMKEYGADQYEVTIGPTKGVRAADEATILRELVRSLSERNGGGVSFTPLRDPAGVGNGVHVHMSLHDENGATATFDPQGPQGMSKVAGSFVAGVLKYLDSIVALTAPSVVSYARLTPHRWSAVFNNLGYRDREASVRICPTSDLSDVSRADQYNFEFRAADAAASPHLQLAAIVHAGAQGIEENLETPASTHEDLSVLSDESLSQRGLTRLPASLGEALEHLESNTLVRSWFPDGFVDVYLAHKRGEMAHLQDLSEPEVCAAYEAVY
ncbi:MAG: glutamine synthetase family protein [Gammaproteobacteria bacterium]